MIRFIPVWFDSMGSKSASVFVETSDVKIFIDPGLSGLQPGFPLPDAWKSLYNLMGFRAIEKLASISDVIIITHYHFDHFEDPYSKFVDTSKIYCGKTIIMKDPNTYINRSQHERARVFIGHMVSFFLGKELEEFLVEPQRRKFESPIKWIPIAVNKDFGDYNRRRRELLSKGEDRFWRLCDLWTGEKWIDEIKTERLNIQFADGREFVFGGTKIRFTRPMFHGLEFDRLGWVVGLTVESGGEKLLYSSDVQGPIVEDYAEWIVVENPDIMIIDGPPTYQFGYMLTRTTLNRAIDNMVRILRDTDCKTIIWDHHLFRDVNWFERVKRVYEYADKHGINVMSAAEFYEKKPVALMARLLKRGEEVKREDFIIPPGVEV